MYDELVKRLREADEKSMCGECGLNLHTGATKKGVLFAEAADAIETLCEIVATAHGELANVIQSYEESKPRWIPVTERFPFAESGDVSEKVLVTDGRDVAIAEWFNFEMYEPYWSYTGMGDITHWMPLPEAL